MSLRSCAFGLMTNEQRKVSQFLKSLSFGNRDGSRLIPLQKFFKWLLVTKVGDIAGLPCEGESVGGGSLFGTSS